MEGHSTSALDVSTEERLFRP
ncbi:hypothetical protein CCACVL1_06814, partial [Corchorus capsularis]